MRSHSQHVIKSVRPSDPKPATAPPSHDLLRSPAIWREVAIIAPGLFAAVMLLVAFGADLAR